MSQTHFTILPKATVDWSSKEILVLTQVVWLVLNFETTLG